MININSQLDEIYRHCNQKSIRTRKRYLIGAKKVCEFVSKEYGLSRFIDLSEKHIYAYVQYARENEICDSTISTDISGVYFFYRFSGGTNLLPKKDVFHFRKAGVQPEDIRWTDDEIIDALLLAQLQKRKDVELAFAKET